MFDFTLRRFPSGSLPTLPMGTWVPSLRADPPRLKPATLKGSGYEGGGSVWGKTLQNQIHCVFGGRNCTWDAAIAMQISCKSKLKRQCDRSVGGEFMRHSEIGRAH